MNVTIEKALAATPDLVSGLNGLLPQLSSSAPLLTMKDLQEMVDSDAVTLFVATDGGVTVGTLTLVVFSIPTGLRAWIEDVIVDEGARGIGIGEALIVAAINEARTRGVRSIDLTSRPSRDAANALYRRLGFERRDTNVYRFMLDG